MYDAQDEQEKVPRPQEWQDTWELTPRDGTWPNRGTTNAEFIELFLAHARKPFREAVSAVLDVSLERAQQLIEETSGGWLNTRTASPFGLSASWPAASDDDALDRWTTARKRGGRLRHLDGQLKEVGVKGKDDKDDKDDELCPVRGTMTAGLPRRIVRNQLLVLDRSSGDDRDAQPSSIDERIREAVERACDHRADERESPPAALGSVVPEEIIVESVALDRALLHRVTIPFELACDDKTSEIREEALEHLAEELAEGFPALEGRARATSVLDPISHTAFQPGSITFQPGTITFQPGSITFQPGSITFQPGSITFQPGSITFQPVGVAANGNPGNPNGLTYSPAAVLPRPTTIPAGVLASLSDTRWHQATSMSGPSRPITIAVLDTGIDQASMEQHPLLVGQSTTSRELTADFEVPPVEPVPATYGHGTFIAGLIAQRAPFALINHETVRNDGGVTDAFEITADLNDVMAADIICLSFGIAATKQEDVAMLHEAVKYLHAKGKVMIAAAGNITDVVDEHGKYDPATRFYPAAFPEVLGVGAADRDGKPAPFSPVQDWVDVWSYGVNVISAFPVGNIRWSTNSPRLRFDGWASWSGSSMAAPRVAAAIADAAARTGRSPAEIVEEIRKHQPADVLERPLIA